MQVSFEQITLSMLATNLLQDLKEEKGVITVDQEIVNKWPQL